MRTPRAPRRGSQCWAFLSSTSPSTEDYDRGEKLRHYQQLPSVSEILIVSHRRPHVTLRRRDPSGWLVVEGNAGDTLERSSVGVKLSVDAVYRDGLEDANVGP